MSDMPAIALVGILAAPFLALYIGSLAFATHLADLHHWWTRRRTIPCPYHPDQPASRCTRCRDEAVPPPAGWRDRRTD